MAIWKSDPAPGPMLLVASHFESVAAKLVNGPWCKKNRWAPYSPRETFH